jgi:ribosomal protein S27AE
MNTAISFDKSLIAPCGMNCGTCIAFFRYKNKCFGCRIPPTSKLKTRLLCKIKNCPYLEKTSSMFCYECEIFPCKRLKNIDKRYRTKYKTSFIENLQIIKEKGIDNFLVFETNRRTCSNCGSILSVHRDNCLQCGKN